MISVPSTYLLRRLSLTAHTSRHHVVIIIVVVIVMNDSANYASGGSFIHPIDMVRRPTGSITIAVARLAGSFEVS